MYVAANFAYQVEQIHHQLRCKYFTTHFYTLMGLWRVRNQPMTIEMNLREVMQLVYFIKTNRIFLPKTPSKPFCKFVMNNVENRQ